VWEGKTLESPEFRKLFTRESLLASDWYNARLAAKHKIDRSLWQRHVDYLDKFSKRASHAEEAVRLDIPERLKHARQVLDEVSSPSYMQKLLGTTGVEPIETFL
jgi:3-mercaptopyruvate sulfurtransferase SseA